MTCQRCGGELTRYDEFRVACRKCHQVWTLPEHADKPREQPALTEGSKRMVRMIPEPRVPAWAPGAALGGLALLIEALEVIL